MASPGRSLIRRAFAHCQLLSDLLSDRSEESLARFPISAIVAFSPRESPASRWKAARNPSASISLRELPRAGAGKRSSNSFQAPCSQRMALVNADFPVLAAD